LSSFFRGIFNNKKENAKEEIYNFSLTFFFLIWPYDASRPLLWRDGINMGFWLWVLESIIFAILAIYAYRHLAEIREQAVEDQSGNKR